MACLAPLASSFCFFRGEARVLEHLRGHRSSLPFGLRLNCSHRKDFSLTCDEYVVPHKLTWGSLQVFNLSVERGEMNISLPISYACYNGGQQMNYPRAYYYTYLIKHSTFTFSNKNKFTTIGCDTLGLFSGSWGKEFTGGCATYCNNLSNLPSTSSSCDGVGCCQTAIPKGVRKAYINISSFNNYSNLSPPANGLNCGCAFLVGEENFTIQPDIFLKTADQLLQHRPSMPVLVDWAIGGEGDTCKTSTGEKGTGGSGCLAKHSECINSTAGYAYRCNSSEGYHGNPHLENDGCQDINECGSPDLHNCAPKARCVNMDGGYRCECPDGQKGNGTKGGEGCKPDIPVAYRAVGTITHQSTFSPSSRWSTPSTIYPTLTFCQLAGVVAVEVAGSPHVAFHPGHEDNAENMPPHDIGTKDSIVRYLREVLIDSSLSLCVHDIVAISPRLRCNKDCSGFQFTWPPPLTTHISSN